MTEIVSGPRTITGRRMHLLDSEAYAVVIDSAGNEISDRLPGRAWIAVLGVQSMQFVFDPDSLIGVATTVMPITAHARGASCVAVFIGDDRFYELPTRASMRKGQTFNVDWQPGYDVMA